MPLKFISRRPVNVIKILHDPMDQNPRNSASMVEYRWQHPECIYPRARYFRAIKVSTMTDSVSPAVSELTFGPL